MKARKLDRRDEWRREQDACFNPACPASYRRGDLMDVHECIGGSDRAKTIEIPAYWIFVCRTCHDTLPSRPNRDQLIQQLAWKKWGDPENYDPTAVIMMWRPNGTLELMKEIVAAVNATYAAIVSEYA